MAEQHKQTIWTRNFICIMIANTVVRRLDPDSSLF